MKRLLMVALVLIFPFGLFAQFSVGVKTSVPFFNANRPFGNLEIKDIELSDMGYFPFINVGVFFHYSLNSSLALQTEIKYTYEGFMYENKNIQNLEYYDQDGVFLKFIEVPLLLQQGMCLINLYDQYL
jgi:hypothetical protein